jgi:hypothetical protein
VARQAGYMAIFLKKLKEPFFWVLLRNLFSNFVCVCVGVCSIFILVQNGNVQSAFLLALRCMWLTLYRGTVPEQSAYFPLFIPWMSLYEAAVSVHLIQNGTPDSCLCCSQRIHAIY